jgi:hypothetical protein
MKRFIVVFAALLFVIVLGFSLSGCSESEDGNLPVETIDFAAPADDKGDYQYYTNDEQRYGNLFWTLLQNPKTDKDNYEIIANKTSGASDPGYGMLFGVKNIPELNGDEFYRALIGVEGYYHIGKRVVNDDGTGFRWMTLIPKTGTIRPISSLLINGYNQDNTLRVQKTGNTFTIYFNGETVDQFTDDTPLEGDGRIGFTVVIGSETNENFPNQPVDVRFSAVGD